MFHEPLTAEDERDLVENLTVDKGRRTPDDPRVAGTLTFLSVVIAPGNQWVSEVRYTRFQDPPAALAP
jgi:hypothetical protein